MENIAVIFGGRSVEHEVSVITGMQIIENMDKARYNPIPVYIHKDGKFYSGEALKDFATYKKGDFSQAEEVFFKPIYGDHNLYTLRKQKGGFFSKETVNHTVVAKIDGVFPALHGTFGEDGCIQGLFELMGIPYVGCGVLSSSTGMDKVIMKKIFQAAGIPITQYAFFYREELKDLKKVISKAEEIGYPLFVKPANLGSSIGISKAKDQLSLCEALEVASKYDRKIIIEKSVENPREINAAVLGYNDILRVSPCEEPIGWKDLLKYEDKYVAGAKGTKGSQKNQKRNLPADLKPQVREKIEQLAKEAFRALDCMGDARIDFLLEGDQVYVNEINTLPGSIAFYLWEAAGLNITELITELIEMSKIRKKDREDNMYSYDSNLFTKTSYGAKL